MTITWKTVSAPNLPEGNPAYAAALFSRTMQNFNERMQQKNQESAENQRNSAAQQAYYDLETGRGDPQEIMQKAASNGYLDQIMDLSKTNTGLQQAQFNLGASAEKHEWQGEKAERESELHPLTVEGKAYDNMQKSREEQKAAEQAQLDYRVGQFESAYSQLSPENQSKLKEEADRIDPNIWKNSSFGKLEQKHLEEQAKKQGSFQGEIDPFGNTFGSGSNVTGGSPSGMTPEQVAIHEAYRGPVIAREGKAVPKSIYSSDYLPKNKSETLRKMFTDSTVANAMGWGPKERKWFSNFRPWSWGEQERSKFWDDVKEMPEEDQTVIEGMMTLYNAQDPREVNQWFKNVANKASLTGTLDKKELAKQIEKKVLLLHQNKYPAGSM
jgi:hypothetical protein